jgi:hypothetical protein
MTSLWQQSDIIYFITIGYYNKTFSRICRIFRFVSFVIMIRWLQGHVLLCTNNNSRNLIAFSHPSKTNLWLWRQSILVVYKKNDKSLKIKPSRAVFNIAVIIWFYLSIALMIRVVFLRTKRSFFFYLSLKSVVPLISLWTKIKFPSSVFRQPHVFHWKTILKSA